MGIFDLAKRGRASMKSVTSGYGAMSSSSHFNRIGGGEGKNWAAEIGHGYDNSIFYALIMGAWNWMTEVDIYVRRPASVSADGKVKYNEVPNHPITQLLKNPNDWYGGETWLGGCIVSELASPRGCSYTYKHRSTAGKLIGLEYVPHQAIWPYVSPGSGNFIDEFHMSIAGGYAKVATKNILQQRFGFIDPRRVQVSVGPLYALIMEVATDKEAALYTLSILHNMGVTPTAISPHMTDEDGKPFAYSTEQLDEIEAVINTKITNDNRGRPVVFPLPIRVDSLGSDPGKLNLEGLRNIPEERACAALNIHPLSVYLGTALQQSNNRASSDSAFKQTARSFTKPYMKKKGAQLTRDLVPELGEPGDEVCFRIGDIEALQEDKTESANRKATSCGGPWLTPNEVREEEERKPLDGGDDLRTKSAPEKDSGDPEEEDDELNDDDPKGKKQ